MKVRGWISGLRDETGDRELLSYANAVGLDVHDSAFKLLEYDKAYRPKNLLAFMRSREDLISRIPADA